MPPFSLEIYKEKGSFLSGHFTTLPVADCLASNVRTLTKNELEKIGKITTPPMPVPSPNEQELSNQAPCCMEQREGSTFTMLEC
jgi:hypothetical protein